jgi:DNA-binding SARP family transcriptional activator
MHLVALPSLDRPGFPGAADPFAGWLAALARWQPGQPGLSGHSPVTVVLAPVPESVWHDLLGSRLGDQPPAPLDPPATGSHTPPISVGVLGELEVVADGRRGGVGKRGGDGLRRRRVRTLLELLALLGSVRRERLADLMWPDLEPSAASANLRVTLTRLRATLASPTGAGESPLVTDGDRVSLSPTIRLDLCEFDVDVALADAAARAGDEHAERAALERACARWRGDPLPDLDGIDEVAGELEQVRRRVTSAALRLAARQLETGRFADAVRWAERVRVATPYDERAHRLAIAANLEAGDRVSAAEAARATRAMLAELEVDAEPATAVLLARVGSERDDYVRRA